MRIEFWNNLVFQGILLFRAHNRGPTDAYHKIVLLVLWSGITIWDIRRRENSANVNLLLRDYFLKNIWVSLPCLLINDASLKKIVIKWICWDSIRTSITNNELILYRLQIYLNYRLIVVILVSIRFKYDFRLGIDRRIKRFHIWNYNLIEAKPSLLRFLNVFIHYLLDQLVRLKMYTYRAHNFICSSIVHRLRKCNDILRILREWIFEKAIKTLSIINYELLEIQIWQVLYLLERWMSEYKGISFW